MVDGSFLMDSRVAAVIVFILFLGLVQAIFRRASLVGARGERLVMARLRKGLPTDSQILHDIYVPMADGTTTQIDIVVVNLAGIFIVEVKNYSGWIFGDAHHAEWAQTSRRRKFRFQNPMRQNYRHVCALAEHLKLPKNCLHNVVAFTGNCTFKTEMPQGVVYSKGLAGYIGRFSDNVLTSEQLTKIVAALNELQKAANDDVRRKHVANLKQRHER